MPKALVLTSISGARLGVRYMLSERSNIVGSAPGCSLTINDRAVDARHAEVKQLLDSWFILPLSPRGGIFVNGEAVRSQARLRPGDALIIGSSGFSVALEDVGGSERVVGQKASSGLPRLGDFLVSKGLLTRSQLERAVRRQEDLTSSGRRVPLGDVLVQLGYIPQAVIDQALRDNQLDMHWHD